MKRRSIFLILVILIIGFVIRIYKIQALPMYGDELTMVYDGYSIIKTGMDATGQKLPLTFHMGAGRPGGYIYFSLPFITIFGPNVWGERTLSIISGIGIIVLMYLLGKRLFGEKIGLIAAALTTISPWDIYLSRGGFEAHFALFLALLGILMFLNKKYIFWAIIWGVTVFTYPTFKLTLPIIFILLVWFVGVRQVFKNKIFYAGIAILLIFAGFVIKETLVGGSEQRFLSENIFANESLKQNIIQIVSQERNISTLPDFLKPIFINREIEYGKKLLDNYVANLSPKFLILRGDENPRQNPGEMGMFYYTDLLLILVGFAFLWKDSKKLFVLLLGWILITPLATMFFPETHALRNGLMLPSLITVMAYAFTKIPRKYSRVLIVIMAIQLTYILVRIYWIAPAKFASFWSADAKREALLANEKAKRGEKVILNITKIDNIEYAYEVYAKVDPKLVISQYQKLPKLYGNVVITDK